MRLYVLGVKWQSNKIIEVRSFKNRKSYLYFQAFQQRAETLKRVKELEQKGFIVELVRECDIMHKIKTDTEMKQFFQGS